MMSTERLLRYKSSSSERHPQERSQPGFAMHGGGFLSDRSFTASSLGSGRRKRHTWKPELSEQGQNDEGACCQWEGQVLR